MAGNPPYGAAYPARHKELFRRDYATARTVRGVQKGSLNTYGLFIELGYNLLAKGGNIAFIVPIYITSSEAMTGVHRLLFKNCHSIRLSSYAVRPKPVFENAIVDVSILLFTKTETPCKHLFSTKMYRKDGSSFNLQKLIDNLEFVEVGDFLLEGRIPKISYAIEKSILEKVWQFPLITDYYDARGKHIFHRTSGGRYFKVVTNYPTGSTTEQADYFRAEYANAIGCILSSNLSFWFYQIYSDNLHWKKCEFESFRIPQLTRQQIEALNALYEQYLVDIENNANTRSTSGKSSLHVSSFKEYKIVRSKPIIDEIDDYIGPLYGLTQEEVEFLKNYELRFRMSGEKEAT